MDLLKKIQSLNNTEFLKEFYELDETVKKTENQEFSEKEMAKMYFKIGKNENKIDISSLNHGHNFIEFKENKVVINVEEIENYFINKEDQFLKDKFEIKKHKQLSLITKNAQLREIKDNWSKVNDSYSKFCIYKTNFIYKYEIQLHTEMYKIAKRKIKEMKMLFTNNGEVFFPKSKNKNIQEFESGKIELLTTLKSGLKEINKSNISEAEKLMKKSELYKKGTEFDYKFEYLNEECKLKSEFLVSKQKIIDDWKVSRAEAVETYKKEKFLKSSHNKNMNEELKLLKKESKVELLVASTNQEKREIRNTIKNKQKNIKNSNPVWASNQNIKYLDNVKKTELQKNLSNFNSEVTNVKNNLPIEVTNTRIYLAMIFGFIPGVGQMINQQYKKAICWFVTIPLILLFALYGFGWGNVEGNGIFGLIDFGKNTPNSDGRYFLIEGILSLIFIFISLLIIVISFIDSRSVAKQMSHGARANNWNQTREFLKSQATPYILSFPAIIGITFIVLVPIIATLIISFTNYGKGFDPARPGQFIEWIGFKNFAEIFGGKYGSSFLYVITWTIIWVICATGGSIITGSVSALLINNDRLKGKSFFRFFLILPWAIPAFIMIMMFSLLLGSNAFNEFTQKYFGTSGWTTSQTNSRVALIFIQSWLGQSYLFLLITGVLQGIKKDLYDSSMMDGANKFKQTFRITVPIVLAQIAPLLIGQFVFNFGNFGIINLYGANAVATNAAGELYPGTPGVSDILISFIYKLSTTPESYTYGIAGSFVIVSSFFVVGISALGFKNMKAFKN